MDLSLISLLSFLITFQLLFVGIFLVTHKKGKPAINRLLGFLFILISWNIGDLTLQLQGSRIQWDFLQVIDDGFFLLYGPLIYLYARGVIFKDFKLTPPHLMHLIPYLLLTALLLSLKNYGPVSAEELIANDLPWQFYLMSALIYVHVFTYLGKTYLLLRRYRIVIKDKFSQIERINLDWLSFSLNTFALLTFISLIHNFIGLTENKTVFLTTLVVLLIFVFYFVNKVIFKALRQPEIFAGISQNETIKYAGSNMTQNQIDAYRAKLSELLSSEKPYLDAGLSLNDLSEKLSVSTKHLSQVINLSFDKNFFDFINSYRIREAQRIFKESDDEKLTVLEVMYRSGFNSKSSFNTAFKKETGQTPTEYRKKR